jgi:hypothetical protein
MINYFDVVACIALAYAATFIKEEHEFNKLKAIIQAVISVVLITISLYIIHISTDKPKAVLQTSLSIIVCMFILEIIFSIINIKLFSIRKRNKKFNDENKDYNIDTDLALKIMKIGKTYLETDQNVFDTDDKQVIKFNGVGELLNKHNIHSLQNFIYNIEYIKSSYKPEDTYLNEYNYINKVLYNYYNNIDDEKYNKIKECLK